MCLEYEEIKNPDGVTGIEIEWGMNNECAVFISE
jgi:hypothetical protein